jgi:flavin reductase (DIM6/NTAB) family NADH-FMN oxidoreductase RutF
MVIDPANAGPQNIYKLLIGAVVPRPIAFVSSIDKAGVLNLAPFSFFTVASANPPVVAFVPMVRGADGTQKDTLRNVEAVGEFVLNIVSEDFADKMNLCSADFPPDVDEFAVSGLTPVPSDLVTPPRVGEARVQMECKLVQIVRVSEKPLGGAIVLGEVLRLHLADELFENYRIAPDKLKAIGRMGGPTYVRTTDLFNMERPAMVK